MRLRILSDLHLEFFGCEPPAVDADAVLLAGDIATGNGAIFWAADTFGAAGAPIIYVPGNHDFYGSDVDSWYAGARQCAAELGVLLGERLSHRIEKAGEAPVRILGTTLWTDFALFGADRVEACGALTEHALRRADYGHIRYQGRMLRWQDTKAFHEQMLAWLMTECRKAAAAGEKVVVVSHHAPSIRSSEAQYRTNPVTAGFASNLEAFIAQNVDVFVHGHMHNSSDYRVGKCRVIANPRGYPFDRHNPNTTFENPQFNPVLVVEV